MNLKLSCNSWIHFISRLMEKIDIFLRDITLSIELNHFCRARIGQNGSALQTTKGK